MVDCFPLERFVWCLPGGFRILFDLCLIGVSGGGCLLEVGFPEFGV